MTANTAQSVEGSSQSSISMRSALSSIGAGYIAGSAGLIVGHPLDSLKVLAQTSGLGSTNGTASATNASTTMNQATASVQNGTIPTKLATGPVAIQIRTNTVLTTSLQSHTQTIRNLYAGISGPLVAVGALQAINFAMFDTARRMLYTNFAFARTMPENVREECSPCQEKDYRKKDTLISVTLASFLAGGAVSLFSSPMMVIKTKQQVMLWDMKTAARDTLHNAGGLRNFYMGYGAHVYCDSVGRACYYPTYELLKRYIVSSKSTEGHREYKLSMLERMFCAGMGGSVCWAVIYPFDAVRSRIYAQSASSLSNCGSLEMARKMYEQGGVRLFFRGFGISVFRAFPVAAVVLPVYDYS
eukprot:CAMPEP_0113310336 /NCGR_PEP_ID=MMETSP0010_2-20120614/8023_1 /TAXON_ID=216773 ORGANISM="Corethron hystrix, Strain 308" /NCGR_SAMPLE_ID=MMETSP0010_2 /ASSEMBLY_ACC=CAM_ASM_000155 /LENGTH=356 /DNA_ID=CAMNT_0000165773 /DNA_START=113 /DNA_END=1179 /DNA_ORIENTATION=+ /assembly_acc=CAM_ASM_000155